MTVEQDFEELMLALQSPVKKGTAHWDTLRHIFFAGALVLRRDHSNARVQEVFDHATVWMAMCDKDDKKKVVN
jgi:hypothetical protein